MKTLVQGSAYDKALMSSIEVIKALAKKIKEQASQCMQERLCGVDQTVVRVDRNVDRVDANVLSLLQKMDDLPQALYRLLQSNPLVDRRTGQGIFIRGLKMMFGTDHGLAYPLIAESGTGDVNGQDILRLLALSQPASPEQATSSPGL